MAREQKPIGDSQRLRVLRKGPERVVGAEPSDDDKVVELRRSQRETAPMAPDARDMVAQ